MDGGEDERHPVADERDGIGRARELRVKSRGIRALHLLGRQHELASQARRLDTTGVKDESEPLAAGLGAAGDVGHDQTPLGPKPVHQLGECTDVGLDLLDGHDVKARDDLADTAQCVKVA